MRTPLDLDELRFINREYFRLQTVAQNGIRNKECPVDEISCTINIMFIKFKGQRIPYITMDKKSEFVMLVEREFG